MADSEISATIAVSTRGMTDEFPAANAAGSADARYALADLSGMKRRMITGAETVVQNDYMKVVEATSGTFTLAFAAAATLGDGFWCIVHNSGTGVVTLNPDSSETLHGEATITLQAGVPTDLLRWHRPSLKGHRTIAGRSANLYPERYVDSTPVGISRLNRCGRRRPALAVAETWQAVFGRAAAGGAVLERVRIAATTAASSI